MLFSKLLEVEPYMDEPYYVVYLIGNQDIGLDPNDDVQGMTGSVSYYHSAGPNMPVNHSNRVVIQDRTVYQNMVLASRARKQSA
ncbi:MAG: hypothetical protein A2Z71_05240 [Chloroflexi bacterium RBG_13_50_21]|jgi:hypothetical protein|nr:MAG: hypothetical protein A2Z71_05240 [Chloroflexi bacterium RBG_13_50_21]